MTIDSKRVRGGMFGLLMGDAAGVPYEGHYKSNLPALADLGPVPPEGYPRAFAGLPVGTYSDDGAQALCLLATLLEHGRVHQADFGQRMVNWHRHGYLAVAGYVFDIGIQTADALGKLERGTHVLEAARRDEMANGNGSLMRTLPLALWHRGTNAELIRDSFAQSEVTHAHPRAQLCCALYGLWIRRLLVGERDPDAWNLAIADLCADISPEQRHELMTHINPEQAPGGSGSGYVVDSLHSARGAMLAGSYSDVIRASIALGRDTDTTAAIAGGAAGVRDGEDAIPDEWLSLLRGRELIDPLVDQLVNLLCA